MRSTLVMPEPLPKLTPTARPARRLTTAEVVIIIAIMLLAGTLALAGLPTYAVLELVGGAVFLACRTVKGLRDPRPGPDEDN